MIKRNVDTDEIRIAFCRGTPDRKANEHIKTRVQAVEEHFGDSVRATAELGFRRGFEKAIELSEQFVTGDLAAADIPKYLAAWLRAMKDWKS